MADPKAPDWPNPGLKPILEAMNSSHEPEASPSRRNSSAEAWGLSKQDKWKIASHLHKAIRHGLADDAEQGVRWLAEIDPAYLRYRLAVIAVEDVAAGSPEVIRQAFEGGWNKASIAARGGDEFLVEQARTWASSTKDRTPCAWLSCVRFRDEFEQQWGRWELLPVRKATRLAFDVSQPWWARGLAAWRAAGSDNLKGSLPSLPGNWDHYVGAASELGLPEALLECMKVGGKVQGEAHPIFIPLAGQAQLLEGTQPAVRTIPLAGYAGPWLSAALDKHTSEGKRALARLLQSNRGKVQQLMGSGASQEDVEDLVGRLWFWMEGGLLDRYLKYPTAEAIDMETKRQTLAAAHVNGRALFEAFRDIAAWHQAREAVVSPRRSFGPSR